MKYYKTEIIEAVQRISMYPEEFSNIFIPAIEEDVTAFEQAIGYKLPNDYKYLLSITNGLSFCSHKQFLSSEDKEAPAFKHIIREKSPNDKYLLSFNNDLSLYAYIIVGIWSDLAMNEDDAEYEYDDLAYRYAISHRKGEKPMPDYLVPFCPTPSGNSYCFDTRYTLHDGYSCTIVLWEYNQEYSEVLSPKITHDCFTDFLYDAIAKAETNNTLAEFFKFTEKVRKSYTSAERKDIDTFEQTIGHKLPNDYKYLLSLTNGLSLFSHKLLGVWNDIDPSKELREYIYEDLVYWYASSHKIGEEELPDYLVPFCPAQKGAMFCFDTRKPYHGGISYPVVIWEPKYEYTEERQPRITHDCFADFFNDVFIGWTLSFYDYDGTSKEDEEW